MSFEITRREFIIQNGKLGMANFLSNPILWSNNPILRFGLVTDSHYADREPMGTRFYRGAVDKMSEFVNVMNKEKVDFVVHLGDFKDEGRNRDPAETLQFSRKLEEVYARFNGPRFHCVGNHDVDSIVKTQFLDNIENTGIPNGRSYYSFEILGYHFIVLDANFNVDGTDHFFLEGDNWQNPNLTRKQLEWLKTDLQKTQKPSIVFCHHPLFKYERNGKRYHINEHIETQKILENSNKVQAVFQGHVHEEHLEEINNIQYITQNAMVDFQGIENNSFSIVDLHLNSIYLNGYKRARKQNISIGQDRGF
ncbi:metallophosphoesterase family protein [Zobellia alginiliquefaciens]|uniref:metallophosphoesterase family protein n=1 Tax=Zobellia alginiliquefaciens TaxID=3032586 RepID=UPI0023E45386|nr:metallophosphoesterase [Zobellia alginiliquefaciens]